MTAATTGSDDAPRALTDADFAPVDPAMARIGHLLFHDPVLSGNRNIACGTCHDPDRGGTDGLSLGLGEGARGRGPERTADPGSVSKRVPRNAPALWNLGARHVTVLFHDGRLSVSDIYGNGFDSPAEEWLPQGLDGLLAAQALFPLTAQFEMAGNPSENDIAGAIHHRIDAAWPIVAARVRAVPGYGAMFAEAGVASPGIVDVANALGAFMAVEWRNHDSPYDAHLAGDEGALDAAQRRGLGLFEGRAGCAACHSGPLLSDQAFHALALPQFGPGRTRRFDPYARDPGRMGSSDDPADAYRFRTPALRNVALTAPYGHNGAYPTLEGIVRHHADPLASLDRWDPALAALPHVPTLAATDFVIRDDAREAARHRARLDIAPVTLSDGEVADIVAFLHALTGATASTRPFGRPDTVPSGLPVD